MLLLPNVGQRLAVPVFRQINPAGYHASVNAAHLCQLLDENYLVREHSADCNDKTSSKLCDIKLIIILDIGRIDR